MISSETGKVTPLLLLRIFEARDEFSLFGAYLRPANFRRSPAVGKTRRDGPKIDESFARVSGATDSLRALSALDNGRESRRGGRDAIRPNVPGSKRNKLHRTNIPGHERSKVDPQR